MILLGEDADVRAAVAAMREGAVDFIEKTHVDISIVRRVAYLLDHSQHAPIDAYAAIVSFRVFTRFFLRLETSAVAALLQLRARIERQLSLHLLV